MITSMPQPFHLMAKPAGALCNLDCHYCFYLKKQALYPPGRCGPPRMNDAVLETFVRDTIASQPTAEVTFAWQGGEPTLLGVDFYRKVVALQQRHAGGKRIANALQTNGTLLDDEWGAFLREHRFLVGVSLDGPRELHDRFRQDKGGRPTFDRVMAGLRVLQRQGVDYNLLTVVSAANVAEPRAVYRFLKGTGARFLQFIPLVERAAAPADDLAAVPAVEAVSAETVPAAAYGTFLNGVFDEWIRKDVGRVFVRDFDVMLGLWLGQPAALCVYAETCGRALAVEHNGDVYACDHYVYESHRRGNLTETPLAAMVDAPDQWQFGRDKSATLPRACRECRWRFACQGGCPKHRFARTADGEGGLSYLCPGLRRFFAHIDGPMRDMAALWRAGRPAAAVMKRRR